jgi:photosystem II stability/assembly factor-like uncharacterized protein
MDRGSLFERPLTPPLMPSLRILGALLAAVPAAALAQRPAASPEAEAIRRLQWRSIGPANNAGRISVVTGVPGDPTTYYVAGAAGGIAKTTNGGATFRQIFDGQDVLSIGAIAVAPSDPNIIYVGSGEGDPRNSTSFGDGMYKSTDAGNSWTKIGLDDTDRIKRVVVDSRNPDVVYACALGHAWGPNEERGVFKTTDGGKTWKKQLYKNATTGCSDLDIDPTNSNIVYAGMYTFRRWAWIFESGSGETAVYKSIDGGNTWKRLSQGLPRGAMERIGIAVSRSEPNVVYVVSETKTEGELWRSDDAGDTWRTVNRDPNINFRPFYYSDIRVDPQNSNRVFSLSGSLNFSDDGGRTFQQIAQGVHGDHQAMWIDPLNPKRILSGSDGGWQISQDGGRTWNVENMVAFTQFYHINYDLQKPYNVCGGLQDNGHWCGPSNSLSGQGIRKSDWVTISGGDGFFAVPDQDRPYLVYSASQGGNLEVTDLRTGMERSIHPYPNRLGSVGDAMESHKYRFNWNTPIVLSPQDPKTMYFGGNVLFKTTTFGQSWEVISPDLTTNDKNKQKSSGGAIVVDNTAAEFHCTIITIAPSPVDPNVIWVGTDDGNVQVTRDGGKTWTNVVKNITGLAPAAWIPTVEASPHDAGTAYVAADHHQDNDYTPYLYKTSDFGRTWTKITTGLPAKGWAHVIREDPRNRNVLYAGTEVGVFASWNGGANWVSIRNGLPPVPVRDIQIHKRDNDIILATHGRGVYILDDATPIQQLAQAQSQDVVLFDIPAATRWISWNRDGNLGTRSFSAQNPPAGAMISYFLKSDAPAAPTITIADKSGKVVRTMRNLPRDDGVNRTTWNLAYDPPAAPAGGGGRGAGAGGGGRGGRGAGAGEAPPPPGAGGEPGTTPDEGETPAGRGGRGGGGGIAVLPGEYTVTLAVGDKRVSKPVHVEADPRVKVTDAELVAQYNAAVVIQALAGRVNQVVAQVDDLLRQLTALTEQLRPGGVTQQGANSAAAFTAVQAATTKLRAFKDDELARPLPGLGYRQYPRLREEVNTLSGMVGRAQAPPTDPQMARAKELEAETTQAEAKLASIVSDDIGKVNQLLTGMPHVITRPAPKVIP